MLIPPTPQAALEGPIHALVKQDRRLKPIFELAGMPALRRREPGYGRLAAIICGPQLSTPRGAAILARVRPAVGPVCHPAVRRGPADPLGPAGVLGCQGAAP